MNTEPNKSPSDKILPPIFYERGARLFWKKNQENIWAGYNDASCRRFLKSLGYESKLLKGESISQLDQCIADIQEHQSVAHAGIVAGYPEGIHDILGAKVLITESPILIEPVKGEFPLFKKFTDGLFHDDQYNQKMYVFGWLKLGAEAVRSRKFRPGQMLVVAGPADCGKSYLQNLITLLLGGTAAKPYQFMTGGTSFNADLFNGIHLMVEDDADMKDGRSRANFGAQLKTLTVNKTQRCHAKGRTPVMYDPLWRISMSVNNNPESLMVMPLIDESNEDKIILIKASMPPSPFPTLTADDYERYHLSMVAELPAVLWWLLNEFEIPEFARSARFGITHFHHPEILKEIDDMSPELRLMQYIDAVFFDIPGNGPWEGDSNKLQNDLLHSQYSQECRNLLYFNSACGTYLARLEKKFPSRISQRRNTNGRIWLIKGPM